MSVCSAPLRMRHALSSRLGNASALGVRTCHEIHIVQRRLSEAKRQEEKRLAARGVGVTPEAQAIFDFLNKT